MGAHGIRGTDTINDEDDAGDQQRERNESVHKKEKLRLEKIEKLAAAQTSALLGLGRTRNVVTGVIRRVGLRRSHLMAAAIVRDVACIVRQGRLDRGSGAVGGAGAGFDLGVHGLGGNTEYLNPAATHIRHYPATSGAVRRRRSEHRAYAAKSEAASR